MRYFLSLLTSILFSYQCLAQSAIPIQVEGTIIDESGKPLYDCYVQLRGSRSKTVYAYFNTGTRNSFTTTTLVSSDTILLKVTHIGYADTTLKKWVATSDRKLYFNVQLRFKANELNGVTVKSPPLWKHGDSTFYRVDYFKEGDEKKLKDLIVKMPGFEITDDGILLYKKKPVDKIKLDGEELFTDKIALLLNSVPVHVLATIQAIEHASSNRLLKGLSSEDLVEINLGMNKTKLQTALGDGEIGVGTNGRYLFNPVLFSLYSAVKVGFIANYNNVANGIGLQQETELQQEQEKLVKNWMMSDRPIQTIANFENRWYIKNAQWDSRLQVNFPISTHVKSQLQVNYLRDKQGQHAFRSNSLYNDTAFIQQYDTGFINYKPDLLNVQHTLLWSMDSTRELKFTGNFWGNYTRGNESHNYLQNDEQSILNSNLSNHWQSLSLTAGYTHRISATTAQEVSLGVNFQHGRQNAWGYSNQWPVIFNLSQQDFNNLVEQTSLPSQSISARWRFLNQKKGALSPDISFSHFYINPKNNLFLTDTIGSVSKVSPDGYSNSGTYQVNTLRAGASRPFRKVWNGNLLLGINGGMSFNSIEEKEMKRHFSQPVLQFTARYGNTIAQKYTQNINLTFSQDVASPYQLQGYLYPVAISAFRQSINVDKAIRFADVNYSISRLWPNLSTSLFSLYFRHQFSGFASGNNYSAFASVQTDSLVNRNAGNFFGANAMQIIPSAWLNTLLTFKAGYNTSRNLAISGSALLPIYNNAAYFSLIVKKNWQKKYFIDLSSTYTLNHMQVPAEIKGALSSRISDWNTSLKQRYVLSKQMNLAATVRLIDNNLFTRYSSTFVFGDMEFNYKLKKAPLFVILRGENLTNLKRYYNNQSTPFSQSFYTVPLLQRSLLITLRYEL